MNPETLGTRPLRGATLGTGSISLHHLLAWQAIPGVEIVALANRTRSKAVEMGARFGIDEAHIYADYRELLAREQIDFVDIATAPHVHREQVLAAAGHGLAVLCQKPFATSIPEAIEMMEACERAGVRCIVNENWRWRRWYRALKQMLDARVIGKPRYARLEHRNDSVLPQPDGTPPTLITRQPYVVEMPHLMIYEMGIHFIDVMRFLFGDIRRVYAYTDRISPLVRGEDMATVLLEFDGLTACLDLSWATYVPEEKRSVRGQVDALVVEGDQGTIEFDPQDDMLIISTPGSVEKRPARAGLSRAEAYQESYLNTQSHFVESLRSGRMAENEARDNFKTFLATMLAYRAAELRTWVEVDGRELTA